MTFGAHGVTFGAPGVTFGAPVVTFGAPGGSFELILESLDIFFGPEVKNHDFHENL